MTRCFRVAPAVAHREVAGRTLILLPGERELYTLNGSGARAWKALVRGRSIDSIATSFARRYGIARERALRDLERLARDLVRRGALRRA